MLITKLYKRPMGNRVVCLSAGSRSPLLPVLRRTKQNLKHATPREEKKNEHTLSEPNLVRSKKFLKQKINLRFTG